MRVASRLRLRIAGGFALALAATLVPFSAAALWHQWDASHRRLDRRLEAIAGDVERALQMRQREAPALGAAENAREVLRLWPRETDAVLVLDDTGGVVAALDPDGDGERVLAAMRGGAAAHFDVARDGPDLRAFRRRVRALPDPGPATTHTVVAFASTEGIEGDTELLAGVLLLVTPLLIATSLAIGYGLAGHALAPMRRLGDAIDAISPADLGARLPADAEPGEVAALTERINTLLGRLERARRGYRTFVRQAAHQIRTPLTLVLGEGALALQAAQADREQLRLALERTQRASTQIARRVDELFLFAEAEAQAPIARNELVELDALALDCVDLMRGRAEALGRTLALGAVAPVKVRGDARILREGLLEMIENGCRHGTDAVPVTIDVEAHPGAAHLVVRSGLPGRPAPAGTGLGTGILEWIAQNHGGTFERRTAGALHEARLILDLT